MRTLSLRFLWWTLLLVCIARVQAEMRNIIVDDAATNLITYSKGWNKGEECGGCSAKPDKNKIRDGTWHDGTESADRLDEVFFTFTFTGTSVEVRYTAIDLIDLWTTNTNVSYSLDGTQRGVKVYEPTNQTQYLYNQELFRLEDLPNEEHHLRVDLQRPGVLLFDYLKYTGEAVGNQSESSPLATSSPSPSNSPVFAADSTGANVGAIVGGVVSGVLILIVASTSCYYLKRRRMKAQARLASTPIITQVPYHLYPPTGLAGQAPYKRPHAGRVGTGLDRPPVSSQRVLPIYKNSDSRPAMPSEVPSGTLLITPNTSQAPLMSTSVSHSSAPPRSSRFHSSSDGNQMMSPPVDELAEQGLVPRRYSPQSLPPPYSPGSV